MRKVYYIYNPKTRTYDRIYPTMRQRALSYLRQLFVGMGLGAGSFILLLWIFGSPSEKTFVRRIPGFCRSMPFYPPVWMRLKESCNVYSSVMITFIGS